MNKKTDKAEVRILHALERLGMTPAFARLAVDVASRADRVSLYLDRLCLHNGEWREIEAFSGWFEPAEVEHLARELDLTVVDRRLPY